MTCDACHKENPLNVQFCLGCGHQLKATEQSVLPALAPARTVGSPFSSFTNQTTGNRPFGLTFTLVVTFFTALSWLISSGFLTMLTVTESIANSNALSGNALNTLQEQSGSIFLSPGFVSISSPLLTLAGFIGVTGAIGLWSRLNWARLLTAWLQVFGIVVGLVVLSQAGARVSSTAGLGGFFAFSGLIIIAYSSAIMTYLLRRDTALWFNE